MGYLKNKAAGKKSKITLQALEPRYLLDAAAFETFDEAQNNNQNNQANVPIPPENDTIAGAVLLNNSLNVNISGTTENATQADGPFKDGTDNGVWYKFEADQVGTIKLEITQNPYRTRTFVYATTDSTPEAADNILKNKGNRTFNIRTSEDTNYFIMLDGRRHFTGDFVLKANFTPAPINDDVHQAIELNDQNLDQDITGTNVDAFIENNLYRNGTQGTVWYKYIPTDGDGIVTFEREASSFKTAIAVFKTDQNIPQKTDRILSTSNNKFEFNVDQNFNYFIAIDGKGNQQDEFTFTLTKEFSPENDSLNNPTLITINENGTINGTVKGAIIADGKDKHGRENSVWYRIDPETSGVLNLTYKENNKQFATYIYETDGSLPEKGQALGLSKTAKSLTFGINQSKTYYILIDGFQSKRGDFEIDHTFTEAPRNDLFENVIDLGNVDDLSVNGTTIAAIGRDSLKKHGTDNGVWYKYTPRDDLTAKIKLQASKQHFLYVYDTDKSDPTPNDLNNLNVSLKNGAYQFTMKQGRNYYFIVDGRSSLTDDFTFNLESTAKANDQFAKANFIGSVDQTVIINENNVGAHNFVDPNNFGSSGRNNALWYVYKALEDGVLTIDDKGSFRDRVYKIYTSPSLTTDPQSVSFVTQNTRNDFNFNVTKGHHYYIAIDGKNSKTGDIKFELSLDQSVDHSTKATALSLGDTGNAIIQDQDFQNELWYRYIPTKDKVIQFAKEGTHADYRVKVFESQTDELVAQGDNTVEASLEAYTEYLVQFTRLSGDQTLKTKIQTESYLSTNNFVNAASLGDPETVISKQNLSLVDHEADEFTLATEGSEWYQWTAHQTGFVSVQTQNTTLNTTLAVYEKQAGGLGAQKLLSFNDDALGTEQSKVDFYAETGKTYLIQMDADQAGEYELKIQTSEEVALIPEQLSITIDPVFEGDLSAQAHQVKDLYQDLLAYNNTQDQFGGIAIVDLQINQAPFKGVWQFSLNNTDWQNVGAVSETNALILHENHFLRFLPDSDFSGSVETNLTVRLLKDSSTLPAGENQNISAFVGSDLSTAQITTSLEEVLPVADQPNLSFTLANEYIEDVQKTIRIAASLNDLDGSEELDVFITNLDAQFSVKDATFTNDKWVLDPAQLNNNIEIIAPEHFAGEITFDLSATAREANTNETNQIVRNVSFNVLPALDRANIAAQNISGNESDPIKLDIDVQQIDPNQQSEITLENVPEFGKLSDGIFLGNKKWDITNTDLDNLYFEPDEFANGAGRLTLNLSTSQEGTTETLTQTINFSLVTNAVANGIESNIENVSGQEGQQLPVDIQAILKDRDGSEFIDTVTFLDLPKGVTFSQGEALDEKSWIVPFNLTENLTLSVGSNTSLPIETTIKYQIQTKERSNNSSFTDQGSFNLTISEKPEEPVFTPPIVDAGGSSGGISSPISQPSFAQTSINIQPFSLGNLLGFDLDSFPDLIMVSYNTEAGTDTASIQPYINNPLKKTADNLVVANTNQVFQYYYDEPITEDIDIPEDAIRSEFADQELEQPAKKMDNEKNVNLKETSPLTLEEQLNIFKGEFEKQRQRLLDLFK